jgi:hypothetical protein
VRSIDLFRACLVQWFRPLPSLIQGYNPNDDLRGGDNYPPADANQIADQCGVINLMRSLRGHIDQPTWYHSLGVIGACTDGATIAHEWSSGHPKYTPDETDIKLAQAMNFPPTTCAKLHDHQFEICEACPHWGQIGSPIRLGFPQAATVVAVDVAIVAEHEVDDSRVQLPKGFTYTTANGLHTLHHAVSVPDPEKKGAFVFVQQPFCSTLYYPIKRIHTDEGDMMEIEMRLALDARRVFCIKSSTIAEGGRALAAELGRHSIVAHPGQKQLQDAYMVRWVDALKLRTKEVGSYRHFGWYEKNFLIGTTLLTNEGNQTVLCHGNAAFKAEAFKPTGDYAIWKQVIDTAYNHPDQEALQYLVLTGFAAPLFSLFMELGGVTVYGHSQGSGVGKTTAQRAALSVFGNWQQLQLAEGKATENALWGLMGTYCNLPVVYDELTNQTNEKASDIVFSVASGRQRERLGPDGVLKDNNNNWSTIMMASGNNLISEKISINRPNAEAELSRVFEFTVPNNSLLTPNQARDLFPKLLSNYGHAGIEFMEYVVHNRDAVKANVFAMQEKFNVVTGVTQSERYWSALQASVLTALAICRNLGILQFDMKRMANWIKDETCNSRSHRNESISNPLETMGRMLDSFAQDLLVTHGEGDRRRGLDALVLHLPRGNNIKGRAIKAIDKTEQDILLVSCSAISHWCNEQGASAQDLFIAVVAAGWAKPKHERWSLGKGTKEYPSTTNVKCWVLDPHAMNAESSGRMVAQRLQLVINPGAATHANPPLSAPNPIAVIGSGA